MWRKGSYLRDAKTGPVAGLAIGRKLSYGRWVVGEERWENKWHETANKWRGRYYSSAKLLKEARDYIVDNPLGYDEELVTRINAMLDDEQAAEGGEEQG